MKTTTPRHHRTGILCNGNHQWVRGKRNACITEPAPGAMETTTPHRVINMLVLGQVAAGTFSCPPTKTEPAAYAMKTTNGCAANAMLASQNRLPTQWKPPHRATTKPAPRTMKTTTPRRVIKMLALSRIDAWWQHRS